MLLTLLLPGPESTLLGSARLAITLPNSPAPTAADILPAVALAAPALAPVLKNLRVAVNHRFAAPDTPIRETDEVALIGLVSGG